MAGKRKYRDLKHFFMRGLIQRETWQRTRHYLKSAAECTSRAIVSLELVERPVKSVSQAKQLEGIGGETLKHLKTMLEEKRTSIDKPEEGKFVSSAGGLLVALLNLTEWMELSGSGELALVAEDTLKHDAKKLTEEVFLDDSKGFCQAWWRIEVLIRRDLVKRRQLRKEPVYQLTELGRDAAARLRGDTDRASNVQLAVEGRKTKPPTAEPNDRYLHTNDDGSDGVIMEVDSQEMGGDRVKLVEHCRCLAQAGVRYHTYRLQCGDYRWVWRCAGKEHQLPLIMERKRADDVAHSLRDGRFWRQVNKMVDWKDQFKSRDIPAHIVYIIEGDPSDYVVKCGDGCQGVGRCGNPSLAQVKMALRDLEEHSDLEIHRTRDVEATASYLSTVTNDLIQRIDDGQFDMLIFTDLTVDENGVGNSGDDDEKVSEEPLINQVSEHELTETVEAIADPKSTLPNLHSAECVEDCLGLSTLNNKACEQVVTVDGCKKRIPGVSDCKKTVSEECMKGNTSNSEVLDLKTEFEVFSTFSVKREQDQILQAKNSRENVSDSLKHSSLSSPLKKIKFNSSADFVEKQSLESVSSQVSPTRVSSSRAKLYLMKRSSPKPKQMLAPDLGESLTKTESEMFENSNQHALIYDDVSCKSVDVDADSKGWDCSGMVQSATSFCEKTETLSNLSRTDQQTSVTDFSCLNRETYHDFNNCERKETDVPVEFSESEDNVASKSDSSDSLPDLNFSENLLHMSTFNNSQGSPSAGTSQEMEDTGFQDRREKPETSKAHLTDDKDFDPSEFKFEYGLDSKELRRSPRKRPAQDVSEPAPAKKGGKKMKKIDEAKIVEVASIFPQCNRGQICSALVKCKMNLEQTISELLDSVNQDEAVIDLT